MKRQGKLNMHIISEGLLMLFAKNIKISQCLFKLQLAKDGAFLLRHSAYAASHYMAQAQKVAAIVLQ